MGIEAKTPAVFSVPEIVCEGCANSIRKAVGAVPGVVSVDVDVARKTVAVTHDSSASREAIVGALERAGFTAA
jgi:copper chaperone CopZ